MKQQARSETPTYGSWAAMRERCYYAKHPHFRNYGGRGITVCERWRNSFDNFLADMGERPPGKSLDRFPDKNGNYEPGNCRWATPREQANNRRGNRVLTSAEGESHTAVEWSRLLGINVCTIHLRLRNGWSEAEAVTPAGQIKQRHYGQGLPDRWVHVHNGTSWRAQKSAHAKVYRAAQKEARRRTEAGGGQ